MPISPKEILKGSILFYDGKTRIVKGIGDYIQFEDMKEWIGPGLVQGEPIMEEWLERFLFKYDSSSFCYDWEDPMIHGRVITIRRSDNDNTMWHITYTINENSVALHAIQYVHQLQVLFFGVVGEHLKVPKLKKS